MKKFKIGITIEAESPEKVQKIGNLIQHAVNNLDKEDIIKLLEKVARNPSVVKNAMFFI